MLTRGALKSSAHSQERFHLLLVGGEGVPFSEDFEKYLDEAGVKLRSRAPFHLVDGLLGESAAR